MLEFHSGSPRKETTIHLTDDHSGRRYTREHKDVRTFGHPPESGGPHRYRQE